MTEILMSIKGLHKAFGNHEVLKGIDLEIKQGEVVVIIGPSGSGKSTFLRTMNLLEVPTKGTISFEGVDITDKKNDIFKMREKMGMVFQQFNLFPNMTVLENITLSSIKTKKVSQAEAKAMLLLDKVGLSEKPMLIRLVYQADSSSVLLLLEAWPGTQMFSYLMSLLQLWTLRWLERY
ncbi:ABC transporter, ATP-binding protein [Streptococcus ictaluri 707-05]|uniref:ABC transporter, ATP-binding protein n=1 Tax=Streptococcus ictaluri 707-05 TaxID=764299 RepID=G5K5R7_9STRE|nr:ABC transporter, ATP-binding protein [Streptococcus ictaluri 707-05]